MDSRGNETQEEYDERLWLHELYSHEWQDPRNRRPCVMVPLKPKAKPEENPEL